MITFDLLQFVAVAFVVCGLVAAVVEIAVKNPRSFWEMMSDVRDFAERPLRRSTERDSKAAPSSKSAGPDDPRMAA
jgi:hypothetical protein